LTSRKVQVEVFIWKRSSNSLWSSWVLLSACRARSHFFQDWYAQEERSIQPMGM
jgi:hypothetical protein